MKKPEFRELILIGVVCLNAFATIYVNFNPEREDKLFELYFASVTGLYGYALQGQGGRGGGGDDGNF